MANAADNTISVLINNGFGFKKAVNYPAGGLDPMALVVGDFNGDGRVDVAVVDGCVDENCETGVVGLLLGNGDGTLQVPTAYGVGTAPLSLAVGDLNADGKLDLAIADFVGSMDVLLGRGDGTFQPAMSFGLAEIPRSVILADLNKDGKLDLVVADTQDNVSIFSGNGDGTFQSSVDYPVGKAPASVAVGDFNRDGKADLAVAVSGRDGVGKVAVLRGNGDGTFRAAKKFPVDLTPGYVVAGDFNRDHSLDLATANAIANTVSVLMNSGGTFVSDVSSANPSQFGQPVTFTATVKPSFPSVGTPTGQVAFYDSATLLGKVSLDNNAQASFTTSDLNVGTHTIRAHYSGDSNFNPNHAKPILQVVQ